VRGPRRRKEERKRWNGRRWKGDANEERNGKDGLALEEKERRDKGAREKRETGAPRAPTEGGKERKSTAVVEEE